MRSSALLLAACTATTPTDTEPPGLPECPEFAEPDPVEVRSDAITEASGLVHGAGGLWTHNDSGSGPELYRVELDGTVSATLTLEGAPARDWESLAWHDGDLVVADTGNNALADIDAALIVAAEPSGTGALTAPWARIPLTLPAPYDIEAMTVHRDTLVLLTKDTDGARILTAPWDDQGMAPTEIGVVDVFATGLDADDRAIVVMTYNGPVYYRRPTPDGWLDAFATEPCEMPERIEQNEAVALDGDRVYSIPEGDRPPLRLFLP